MSERSQPGHEVHKVGSVEYEKVEQGYLEKRSLQRTAGPVLLWGLGVGYVISGDYFGWMTSPM